MGGAGEGGSGMEPEFRRDFRIDALDAAKGGPEQALILISSTPVPGWMRFLQGHFGTAAISGRAWGDKRRRGYFLNCRGLNR
jgi:hypothetical protein